MSGQELQPLTLGGRGACGGVCKVLRNDICYAYAARISYGIRQVLNAEAFHLFVSGILVLLSPRDGPETGFRGLKPLSQEKGFELL
jgi:hypothetical protein